MKNIVLKSLELKNFKSFRHAKFDDFNEKENFIYGKNGAGKSTLFDAFLWLLFGKDANDRKDYEIKPLDENNQVQKQIDVEVHATLLINNEEVTLSRFYKERWEEIKGSEERTFKGHKTVLEFNQVPVSLKEFNAKVAEISEESLFKLITNPSAFESLDWKKKREVLVSIAGEVSDEELFNSDADFKELSLKLTNKTLDEYDTQLKASIKKSKQEKEDTPARIDELKNSKIKDIDFNKIDSDIQEKETKISDIDSELENASKSVQNIVDTSSVDALKSKLKNAQTMLQNSNNYLNSLKQNISNYESSIKALEADRADLVSNYNLENAKVFDAEKYSCTCPNCQTKFVYNDEPEKEFNLEKNQKLSKIIDQGNSIKSKIEQYIKQIEIPKGQVQDVENDIKKYQSDIDNINSEIQTETSNLQSKIKEVKQADNSKLKEQKQTLQSEIKQLIELKGKSSVNESIDNRIKELASREKELSQIIASLEKEQFVIERFKKVKTESLEKSVNEKFEYVTFKLFEEQVNGGLNPTCITLVNGVPFGSANTAGKINAGLDIINTLCKVNDITAPVFLDNRESVTELIPTESQIISLIVDPNQETLKFN